MTSPDFQSPSEIESKFETDRAFNEETVFQSLGRLVWLSTRLRAEFALTLFDLGVEEGKIPVIVEAFGEAVEDYYDFARIGFGASRDDEIDEHPNEEALEETVDELMDTIDITNGKSILESHWLMGGDLEMMDYGEMPVDDLLHRLNGHIKRLESEYDQ